jgi:TolB-like protein
MSAELNLDPIQIEEQLVRIISSPGFKNSGILTDFLNFVVTNTIQGNGQNLKEYVIATNVLKRSGEFNPQNDAIVRIHAKRLRDALERYYQNSGAGDIIRISIPKGRYMPVFEENKQIDNKTLKKTEHLKSKNDLKPLIAVLPFRNSSDEKKTQNICSIFCHNLSIELTRFEEIGVVADNISWNEHDKKKSLDEMSRNLGLDYILTGGCFSLGNIHEVTIELISTKEMEQIWAEKFTITKTESENIETYKLIIKKIITIIGGFFGLIYRNILNTQPERAIPENSYFFAVYWYKYYQFHTSQNAYNEALVAIKSAVNNNPQNGLLSSILADIYLNMYVCDFQQESNSFEKGIQCAHNSINIDPLCQHAHLMEVWAWTLMHSPKEAINAAEKCIAINPANPWIGGAIGFGCICTGEYDMGYEIITNIMKTSPLYHWVGYFALSMYCIAHQQYNEALIWAEKINRLGFVWDPILKTSLLGILGDRIKMKKAVEELYKAKPDIEKRARIIIDILLTDEKLKLKIIEGLILAGIPVEN